ncbi:MAG: hypothetical protein BAJATHORv1_30076 [Candidatus Thorarchaeota archaeon]|nr:MAG: hypothetical protein BAJATHORv1_30076 [Candidatus Thorarchaeota archaeon]
MMNEPPYWREPLHEVFTVTVRSCIKEKKEYLIEIAEDVIRAAGGGQDGDRGILRINGQEVSILNTAKQDSRLLLITEEPVEPDQVVQLVIDLKWRKAMMQNHTAEHLFVATMKKISPSYKLGYIWIDGEKGVVDIMGPPLDFETVVKAEKEVTRLIEARIPVEIEIVDAAELDDEVRAREGLASKHEKVRIVQVGDYDSSACSGTHVFNTYDIEAFKVIDYRTVEGGTRIEFLTSSRALEEMVKVYNTTLEKKHSYPYEMDQLGDILDKAKELIHERQWIVQHLSRLMTEGKNIESIENTDFWTEYLPGLDMKEVRSIIRDYPMEGKLAILFFLPGVKSSLIFWTNELPEDASHYISDIVTSLGGRGGGSRDVYTGGFADSPNPEEIYNEIISQLRKRLTS